jgi:hypothetical protein
MIGKNEKKSENIQNLKGKVSRSWYEDGMFEISFGIFMLFISSGWFVNGSRYLPQILPKHLYITVRFLWLLLLIGVILGFIWLTKKLKKEFVWSKVGYSVTKDSYPKSSRIFLILAFLFLFTAVFGTDLLSPKIRIIATGFGLCFAYIAQFFQAGRIRRFLVFSSFPPVIAVINSFLGFSWEQNLYLIIFVIGVASIISGMIVYKNFEKELTE